MKREKSNELLLPYKTKSPPKRQRPFSAKVDMMKSWANQRNDFVQQNIEAVSNPGINTCNLEARKTMTRPSSNYINRNQSQSTVGIKIESNLS
jgi:hypothetical protein